MRQGLLVFTRKCTILGYAPLGLGLHTKWSIIALGLGLGLEMTLQKASPNPDGAYPRMVSIDKGFSVQG